MTREDENSVHARLPEDEELVELFANYVDRLNRGEELHPQDILARHPLVGDKLLELLDDYIEPDGVLTKFPLRILGDYTLRRQIGRGGMGVVYDAWQNSLERQVALKLLPMGVAVDDRIFHRFMREAKTAARLNHDNVVRVFGMGVESNTPYYAMEYVAGRTLAEIIADWKAETDTEYEIPFGPKGVDRHVKIATAFVGVADGLQHAHSKGVIHRDIKPSNLIVDGEGRLRILDFGVARLEGQAGLTLTRDVVGTPLYMSPEQARRRKLPIDHRTDIYSLGATLYEVLANRPPFRGRDNQETLTQIIEQDPSPLRRVNPTVPKSLETIVLKCLRKIPKDRYETAEAVAGDLRRFARGEPIAAQPRPPWSGSTRWVRKHASQLGVAIMVLSLALFILFALFPADGITTKQVLTTKEFDLNNFWDLRPSPDGTRIAYSSTGTDGSLFVRDLESGETTQLTSGTFTFSGGDGPAWSPNGRRIAYTVQSNSALKIVELASKESSNPTGTEGLALTPLDWSPDGVQLLCVQEIDDVDSIVSLSLEDGTIKTLVAEGCNQGCTALFSSDGHHIAYTAIENGNQDIFIIARDGTGKQRITNAPGADTNPVWSPSGNSLIYKAQDGIWSVSVEGGRAVGRPRFVKSLEFWRMAGWTEEHGLFYITLDDVTVFYALPVDPRKATATGEPSLLFARPTKDAHRCVYAPDMERIAFTERAWDGQLHVFTPANRSTRSFSHARRKSPSNMWWSSDGKHLLYDARGDRSSTREKTVYALDVATGQTEQLFPPMPAVERFHISPNGENLVYYRWNGERGDGKREVIVTTIDRAQGGQVLASEQEDEVGLLSNWVRPSFSPDGTEILFATQDGYLWLAATDGSTRRKLARAVEIEFPDSKRTTAHFVHFAAWHPEGTYVVYDNWKTLYAVDVETGKQHELPLPRDVIEYVHGVWQWSPDGKQIIFTGGRGSGPELWTIKNLLATKVAEK